MTTLAGALATPWNGLRAASLFCGVGGSSLGYKMAGFRVSYALDFDRRACRWYERNFGLAPECADVGTVSGTDILDAVRRDGGEELDLLDGSPPCQSFSSAGRRQGARSGLNKFPDFVRLVGEVRPRAFVAENVTGLAHARNEGYLMQVVEELKAHGYVVQSGRVSADRVGVPQARERVIIIGRRSDVRFRPSQAFPTYLDGSTSIREALPHVARLLQGERPAARTVTEEQFRRPRSFPADGPAPTVTTGAVGGIPLTYLLVETVDGEQRPITLDELKALCSFPADFQLPESRTAAWKLLGNCVPPLLAYSWASRLSGLLRSQTPHDMIAQ